MTVGLAFTVRELELVVFALADETTYCAATLILRAQMVERATAFRIAKDIGANVEADKLSQPRVPYTQVQEHACIDCMTAPYLRYHTGRSLPPVHDKP